MNPIILYRNFAEWKDECHVASQYFAVTNSRMTLLENDLVIGRYSVLPFYKELERDVSMCGARLVNTYHEHRYVADVMAWYLDLEGLTPRTWGSLSEAPHDFSGPFVLKGETNSKKFLWNTHMYAPTRTRASEVMCDLAVDGLIGDQRIIVREYVELDTLMVGIADIPITREFRFFVYCGQILCSGFYWASHVADLEDLGISIPNPSEVPESFLNEVISRIGNNVSFYVIDVARTSEGDWVVIELNDGQMSGLSMCDPEQLYSRLAIAIGSVYKEP